MTEKLKRMKSENVRLQEECERLESFMLGIESSKSCNSKKDETEEVEEYSKKLEILRNLEAEVRIL